jgi:hypothetical protein
VGTDCGYPGCFAAGAVVCRSSATGSDVSVHGDDPVDETTPVFTQAEVFMIGGYLAETWADGVPDDATDDTEAAIQAVLRAQ